LCLHGVQGGYYWKSFGKHGDLHNPYAYGYFDHMKEANYVGGHVTVGGSFYRGPSFPEEYIGKYIGGNLLSHDVYWHVIEPIGSTYQARHGGELAVSNDAWCAPTDVTIGPDGAVYFSDWNDQRTAHPDPDADWDRTNGRVYRIQVKDAVPVSVDLSEKSNNELIDLLGSQNQWMVRHARSILTERRDPSIQSTLKEMIGRPSDSNTQLEALWTLYSCGGMTDDLADSLLLHLKPEVRRWVVRYLGDAREVPQSSGERLVQMARTEADVRVRSQLASTAKRIQSEFGLRIVKEIVARDEDGGDPYLPLLLWWALEDKAVSHSQGVLELFEDPDFWSEPIVKGTLVERLARRYTADPTDLNLVSAGTLFTLAPDQDSRNRLITGFAKGLQGKTFEKIPQPLATILLQVLDKNPSEEALAFALRLDHPGAVSIAIDQIGSNDEETAKRVRLIEILGEISHPDALLPLVHLVGSNAPEKVQEASLRALENYSDPAIPKHLYSVLDQVSGNIRSRSINLLAGKEVWTLEFLKKVDSGEIPQDYATLTPLRRMMLHKNEEIADLVEKHYGKIGQESQGLLKGRIRGVTSILGLHEGNAEKGHELFLNTCAKCHTLFGEGNEIGPELTSMDRKNREWLITNIVDPNSIIRPEYQSHVIETADGAILTGMLAQSTEDAVTLITSENETITFPRDEIEEIYESKLSLMPEGLLDPMQPEEVQNLFAYLMKEE
ncbi:MAG: c-type cytochrome, partial [Candidatus Omnitrophica bacterium]|nr:c-type cytochrome [Candidatus Omnitrophota bacterium]